MKPDATATAAVIQSDLMSHFPCNYQFASIEKAKVHPNCTRKDSSTNCDCTRVSCRELQAPVKCDSLSITVNVCVPLCLCEIRSRTCFFSKQLSSLVLLIDCSITSLRMPLLLKVLLAGQLLLHSALSLFLFLSLLLFER